MLFFFVEAAGDVQDVAGEPLVGHMVDEGLLPELRSDLETVEVHPGVAAVADEGEMDESAL